MDKKFAHRLVWELTRACDNPGVPARPRELETEEALTVAAELGRLGCRTVTLSGGEPTLRADWPQITQVLSRSGVGVQLITNGQRFARIEARLARAAGVGTVLLRLDAWATSRDSIRRQELRERLEIAASGLQDASVPLGFIIPAYPQDDASQTGLVHWAKQWDPTVWQLGPCGLRQAKDLHEAQAQDCHDDTMQSRRCDAGQGVLGLRSDGTITGCLARKDGRGIGNVRHSPLAQLWRTAQEDRRQQVTRISDTCDGGDRRAPWRLSA